MLPVKAEQKFAAAKNIDNCYGRVAHPFTSRFLSRTESLGAPR